MTKYELSLSPDYVPSWTAIDAVRELFQNAIDQEAQHNDNKMFHSYEVTNGTLTIGNKTSILETKSLLLGVSTKTAESNTVGQFGEGYKIAALVLTRLGKKMTIYNYGANEVWKPRLSKSRKYNTTILVVEVFRPTQWPWSKLTDNNLTITIEGITTDEYNQIKESNLHLWPAQQVVKGNSFVGDILLDERLKGRVYVNGLYVCTCEQYVCGYNFHPSAIRLDRDRKLVSDWDLKWLASKIWASAPSEAHVKLQELLASNAYDVQYVSDHINYYSTSYKADVCDGAFTSFKQRHGDKAIPVSTQDELEAVRKTNQEPVLVSTNYCSLLKQSTYYSAPAAIKRLSAAEQLQIWSDEYLQYVPKAGRASFNKILQEVRKQ